MKIWSHPQIRVALKIVLAALVLFLMGWAISKVDWPRVREALSQAERWPVYLTLVFLAGFWLSRALIFHELLRLQERFSFGLVLVTSLLGGATDFVIPGRSGYFVRWGVLSLQTRTSKAFIFSALLMTVVFEAGTLTLLFVISAWLFGTRGIVPRQILWLLTGGVIVVLGVLMLARRLKLPLPEFQNARTILICGFAAFGVWACELAITHLCGLAFHLSLRVHEMLLVLMSVNLAIAIPVMPGNIGTMHLAAAGVLTRLGVSESQAVAFAIIFHAVHFLPVVLTGGILSLFYPIRPKSRT